VDLQPKYVNLTLHLFTERSRSWSIGVLDYWEINGKHQTFEQYSNTPALQLSKTPIFRKI